MNSLETETECEIVKNWNSISTYVVQDLYIAHTVHHPPHEWSPMRKMFYVIFARVLRISIKIRPSYSLKWDIFRCEKRHKQCIQEEKKTTTPEIYRYCWKKSLKRNTLLLHDVYDVKSPKKCEGERKKWFYFNFIWYMLVAFIFVFHRKAHNAD